MVLRRNCGRVRKRLKDVNGCKMLTVVLELDFVYIGSLCWMAIRRTWLCLCRLSFCS